MHNQEGLTERGVLSLLRNIQNLRILLLPDRSREETEKLRSMVIGDRDKAFVEILFEDSQILKDDLKNILSQNEKREKWQPLYDKLHELESTPKSSEDLFPDWVIEGEMIRLHYLLDRTSNEFWEEYKKEALDKKHINKLKELFEVKSDRQDYMTCFRRIMLLLTLKEFAHARQSLNEATSIAPEHFPFYIAYANLELFENRPEEALNYLKKAQKLIGLDTPVPIIDDGMCLCYYYMGNFTKALEIAEKDMNEFPEITGFINNYAFARVGTIFWERGTTEFWKDTDRACDILEEFLRSILKIGAFGVAHFNYALLLYWANKEGNLDIAKEIIGKSGGRKDLVNEETSYKMIKKAFRRAKNAFKKEFDHPHALMASYFMEIVESQKEGDLRSQILEKLIWDADNFITRKHEILRAQQSLLIKNPEIQGHLEFDHFTTLKRWMKVSHPSSFSQIQTGGGYFLKWKGKGIVINPGDGFLSFFHKRGYTISEIDTIIITSSAHTAYEEINCLLELVDINYIRNEPSRKLIDVFFERNVFHRFPDIYTGSGSSIEGPMVLLEHNLDFTCDEDVEIDTFLPCSECVHQNDNWIKRVYCKKLSPIVSFHLKEMGKTTTTIGVVNDLCRVEHAVSRLNQADIILLSLGELIPYDLFKTNLSKGLMDDFSSLYQDDAIWEEVIGASAKRMQASPNSKEGEGKLCYEYSPPKNSVGVEGLLYLAKKWIKKEGVIILTDLPLELGDKRHTIASVLNKHFKDGPKFLTEDVGLVLGLGKRIETLCEFDYKMVPVTEIEEECLHGDQTGPVKHFHRGVRANPKFPSFINRHL
ncbi:hypothetical protein JXM67_14160 [candidate division WOR-3 bacterium]|nr:hypothetical protein [candidate division WOR-3 bacterium]